jgi:phospholipase/carboxylesterase
MMADYNESGWRLPPRAGPKPQTTHPTRDRPEPHKQLTQNAPAALQQDLFNRAVTLPSVRIGRSIVSVPGARAWHLNAADAKGPPQAFQAGTEFAHIHPSADGSLHMTLPPALYAEVLEKNWGEPHPISGTMLVFGPRDEAELETVWRLLQASHAYAQGHTL